MAIFKRDNRSIGYNVAGEGAPILAFHGTTQSGNAWDQVRVACAPLQWVNFEFPGSGESSMPDSPIDLNSMVDDAVALMASLGHESFHVTGYSLGAVAALQTAARHSDKVLSVTSLCGWAVTDARMRLTFDVWRRLIAIDPALFMRYALVDGSTAASLAAIEPMHQMVIDMASTAVQPGSDAHLELDIRIDINDALASVSAPCLVIGGIEDRWVDISHSRYLASKITHATLLELPAGHLVIGEMAEAIAGAMSHHINALN